MSAQVPDAPGWWWIDYGPRGRVIPHAVLVEEYGGVLHYHDGGEQRPAAGAHAGRWLGPVAPPGSPAAKEGDP